MRWNGLSRPNLVRAINERFSGIGLDGADGLAQPPNKLPKEQVWWLIERHYGMTIHTGERVSNVTPDEAMRRVLPRLRKLAQMQLESFEDATKLFLFSDLTLGSVEEAEDLFAAVRSVGPNAWLLVVAQDEARAGTAHMVKDGLIAGYVEKLTLERNANHYSLKHWPAMLREARGVWEGGRGC